jgi:hypothetical protein
MQRGKEYFHTTRGGAQIYHWLSKVDNPKFPRIYSECVIPMRNFLPRELVAPML